MKNQKGITLIALVITIIVLIILAGVGINLTLGDNGILRRAQDAQKLSDKATVKEKVEVAIVEVQVEEVTSTGSLTLQKLYETLESKDSNITLNEFAEGDTELTGTYNLNGKTYSIVINNELKVEVGDAAEVAAKPIKFGELVWNVDGTVSVDATTELTGNIEYQVNGIDGEWQTGALPTNLQVGDKLYVRVNDGTTTTEPQEIEIKDTILPEEFTISVPKDSITYEELTISSTGTTDNQTGIRDYSFIVTKKDGTVVKSITEQDVTEYEITGLAEKTEYVVYMLAYDKSGNARKSNEVTVTTKAMPVARMFGQYVNYGIDLDGDGNTTNDWQIFYKEDDPSSPNYGATYIIADYYVSASKMTTSVQKSKMELLDATSVYSLFWNNPNTPAYNTVTEEVQTRFMYSYTGKSNINAKCASTLLNSSNWESDFLTDELKLKEGLVIGAPTIEMWSASWNAAYPTQMITPSVSSVGYKVKGYNESNESIWISISAYDGYKTDAPNVYFPTKSRASEDKTDGYWLASPSAASYNTSLIQIDCDIGKIKDGRFYLYSDNTSSGIRPVVYLPKEVTLEPSGTANLWNINYGTTNN